MAPHKHLSGLFLTFNRNKKSIVIDLKTEDGLAVFYDLVKTADIVVDNFRPGVLAKLNVDYDDLKVINPRIIQCSVTGFGLEGEYKDLPALETLLSNLSAACCPSPAKKGRPASPEWEFQYPIWVAVYFPRKDFWLPFMNVRKRALADGLKCPCSTPC